jgi:hypothetical protein
MPFLPYAESSGAARIFRPLYPVIAVRNTATFCKIVASRHGFQTKLFGTFIFTITRSSVRQSFLCSLFLRVYLQKTKYLCINEIKLLAKLKRISVNYSSHQYNEFIREVVSFNNCKKKKICYEGARGPLCFACSCNVVTTSLLQDRDCAYSDARIY